MPLYVVDGDLIAHGLCRSTAIADVYESIDIRERETGKVRRIWQFVVPGQFRSDFDLGEHLRIAYWAHKLDGAFLSKALFPNIREQNSLFALRRHATGRVDHIVEQFANMRTQYKSMQSICYAAAVLGSPLIIPILWGVSNASTYGHQLRQIPADHELNDVLRDV